MNRTTYPANLAMAALMRRARISLLRNVYWAGQQRDSFEFWQGYAKALNDLQNGTGAALADKDAQSPHEAPDMPKAASDVLHHHIETLTRVEIQDLLTQAGIELPAHALTDGNVVPAKQLEQRAVTAVDLNTEHAPTLVVNHNGSGLHDASQDQKRMVAREGGAA